MFNETVLKVHSRAKQIQPINEQMFDDLGLEQAVMDCCASGRHLTLFSMEDQKSSFGLSKIFNGSIKSRNPSSTNPFGNASLD